MTHIRSLFAGWLLAAAATLAQAQGQPQTQPPPLRAEVGKPLQAAQAAMTAQRWPEALSLIATAAQVPELNDNERYLIARMRGAAAAGAGDIDGAAAAFAPLFDDARLLPAERLQIARGMAGSYAQAGRRAEAVAWAQRALRVQPEDRDLLLLVGQLHYQLEDMPAAALALQAVVDGDQRAGRTPNETTLKMLLNTRIKARDGDGIRATLETIVRHHPSPERWGDLMRQVQRQPGFSPQLGIDTLRLQAASGGLNTAEDCEDAVDEALRAGFPVEAQEMLEAAFAAGVMGTGSQAAKQQALRKKVQDLAAEDRRAGAASALAMKPAKSPEAQASIGYNEVLQGRAEQGLALMQQALANPALREAEHWRLRLGVAQLRAGRKAEALKTLQAVQASDGSATLARLWRIQAEAQKAS